MFQGSLGSILEVKFYYDLFFKIKLHVSRVDHIVQFSSVSTAQWPHLAYMAPTYLLMANGTHMCVVIETNRGVWLHSD